MSSGFTTSESVFTLSDGLEVYTKTWKPSGPAIAQAFFLHGYSDHCNAYYNFPATLASAGIELFSFDQRGWGQTCKEDKTQWGASGSTAQLFADIDELLLQRVAVHPALPLFLIGHSMGGGVALTYAYAGAHRSKLAGVAVWSPMIDTAPDTRPSSLMVAAGRLAAKVFPGMKMVNRLSCEYMSRDAAVNEEFENDALCHSTGTLLGIKEMLDRGKKLQDPKIVASFPPDLPVLVMHGSGDKVTSCDESKKFVERLQVKDKLFVQYDGWYHKLHAEPGEDKQKFADDMVEWLKARCSTSMGGSKL
ncbi:Alpha/Beta hydrolase protein [Sphaerosporella brunnea]|uniref:Alpha/Beta hydrolase protein n=1 Tax=Sphaerosporella brunnea TaxID=1250544 RepID=A0A5J5EF53_9PEZI|nr:Alpha/Beta hydrolase protein [Sphaerosporella brunnea]